MRIVIAIAIAILIFLAGFWRGRVEHASPTPLKCYLIENGPNPNIKVGLTTQFDDPRKPRTANVFNANYLCVPVEKTLPKGHEPVPVKTGDHLVCHRIDSKIIGGPVFVADQFGNNGGKPIQLAEGKFLCEPADKQEKPQPPAAPKPPEPGKPQ